MPCVHGRGTDRWQAALVQASGPVRAVGLTRGELAQDRRERRVGGLPARFSATEVVLGDEASPGSVHLPPVATRQRFLVARVGGDVPARCRNDSTQLYGLGCTPRRTSCAGAAEALGRLRCFDDEQGRLRRVICPVEGLDEPAARRAVGPVQLGEDAPLPAWAATLGEALFTPCYDALPGVCDPEHPIPFETLLLPFLHIYLRRVEDAAAQQATVA